MNNPAPSHGSSLLATANAATTMLASFVGFIVATRLLGADRLGLLALVTAALFPLRFAELGLAGAASRFIGAYAGPDRKRLVLAVWKLVGPLAMVALAILTLACLIVSPALIAATIPAADAANADQLAVLVWLLAAVQLLSAVALASLIGLQRFRLVYLTGITVSVAQLVAIVPLIMALGIAGLVVSQIAGQVVMLLVGLATIWRMPGAPPQPDLPFDRGQFLGFAGQFALNSLIGAMVEPAIKLLFGSQASLKAMGQFEVFWRVFVQVRTVLLAPLEPTGIALVRNWGEGREAIAAPYGQAFVHAWVSALVLAILPIPLFLLLGLIIPDFDRTAAMIGQGVGLAIAFGFMAVPIYYLAVAAGRMVPIMVGSVAQLVLIGLTVLGLEPGSSWPIALAAIVGGAALAGLVQFGLARRLLMVSPLPRRPELISGGLAVSGLVKSLFAMTLGRILPGPSRPAK